MQYQIYLQLHFMLWLNAKDREIATEVSIHASYL